jgi:hypothetical protein
MVLPCQKPIINQHMLKNRGADSGEIVRIVGLSSSKDINNLKEHIEAKKWHKVEHNNFFNGVCQVDKDHDVRMPHVGLIDTHGLN